MKKALTLLLILTFFLAACGARPEPDWFRMGSSSLESYKKGFLAGRDQAAKIAFDRALTEIKSSGDLDLLSKAYLVRCALQAAVLETVEDGDYQAVAAVAPVPQNAAFHAFLVGRFPQVDAAALPSSYRGVLKALQARNLALLEREIARVDDPLSRLIATGVAVRQDLFNDAMLAGAVEAASQNGWKKALLAYLTQRISLSEQGGDKEKAARLRQTIQLLQP